MNRLHLKFCGLQTPEDVAFINSLSSAGKPAPDYVGFVFAESRRQITKVMAQALRRQLSSRIRTAAVLVNAPVQQAAELVRQGIADVLQLHGDEDEGYIQELRRQVRCPLIRAVRLPVPPRDGSFPDRKRQRLLALQALRDAGEADYYLFDATVPGVYGGSGKAADLALLAELPVDKPFFLAGGLTAESVGKAVAFVRGTKTLASCFYGVDVSGGIETDGRKDPRKMCRFAQALRLAEVPSSQLLRSEPRNGADRHNGESTDRGGSLPADMQV